MLQPRLRFGEFGEEWTHNKLSNLSSIHARIGWQNLRTSEFLDKGNYLLITGTDFDNYGNINFKNCHYVNKERYEQDKHIQVDNGNILITKDGTLGKVAFVKGLNIPATLNAGVFNLVVDGKKANNEYLFHFLKAPFLLKYAKQNATGGTIKHLNQGILVDFPIPLSSLPEQQKIGTFFSHLDHLIQLQQAKLEHIERLKTGYLQKLFPNGDSKMPVMRFKGFEDEWKKAQLNKVLIKNNVKNSENKFSLVESVSNSKGFVKQNLQFKDRTIASEDLTNYYVITPNTFAYNPSRINVGSIAYKDSNSSTSLVSPLYISFKTNKNLNDNFVWYWIKSSEFKRQRQKFSEGGVRDTLSFSQLSKFEILLPSLEEQKHISAFFTQLDNLIQSTNDKLTHLTQTKTAYLQKMFI